MAVKLLGALSEAAGNLFSVSALRKDACCASCFAYNVSVIGPLYYTVKSFICISAYILVHEKVRFIVAIVNTS